MTQTKIPQTKRSLARLVMDGWENVITGLGTARDKRTGNAVKYAPSQSSREEFEHLYASDDTAAHIAELPAKEMVREWITLSVGESSGDNVKTENVDDKMATSKAVMQKLEDLESQTSLMKALIWANVHGGSLIFTGVDDGATELEEPLNLDNIRSFDHLLVFDRWEVQIQEVNNDTMSKDYGKPTIYLLQTTTETGLGSLDSVPIHASRFIRLPGVITSRYRMSRNKGWEDSIFTRMNETIADYGISWHAISYLLSDFSQAVFKMEGLNEALVSQESNLIIDRMVAMDMCRSVARAIPIDAESEDFERKVTPMSGLPETIDRLMLRLASAARMPATLLFGQSPSGLNATGDSDIRLFYDHIKARQEMVLRPAINRLLELIFLAADGPTKGSEPDAWSFYFNPLWQITDVEQAGIRKTQAEADQIYIVNGVLSEDEVAQSRFGGETYSTDTQLDMEMRESQPATQAPAPVPAPVAAPPFEEE